MADLWMDVDAALSEVPVNLMPLIDDTDFKTREESVTYDQAGMDLVWNFVTTGGAFTQTAVTPTESAGDYDWTNQGNGMYTIEIPASSGASINNDTEGFGWFSGFATGILPWRGPIIGFRAAGLNNALIDSAHSATRGLAGTALPDAAADAAGGLPISDAGALDIDAKLAATDEVTAARMGALTDWIDGGRLDLLLDAIPTTAMRGTDNAAPASLFTGITSVAEWLGLLAGKQAGDATALTEIKATGAGSGSYDPTTDSGEAIRDHVGDGTNLTEAGGTGDQLAALATAANLATAQADLDTLTGSDGATLATSQPNYAPATAAALATVDGNVDSCVAGIIEGAAATGTLSTTQATSDLTGYANDQLIGRVIIWTSGDCEGEATDITDYASASGLLTFTALTTAPGDGDTFKIV